MARLLKVSRSGYYKWSHNQQQRLLGNDDRAAFYDDVDRKIHQIWADSDQVYGAPRITAELAEGQVPCSGVAVCAFGSV
ncbi:hypothetical protein QP994_10530 [Corynebacterium sp. MSK044]|uniref:IS3 family transposase n=1 Tax=Corynebacterium sp. MSK044 TaxID=3050195 RepID=UPI002550A143|nr:IS3 family transposase [Corynebacterium sp. MSK044]MDK8798306.1 hypothetical protein [Corynebacterium sp. MSK044]